MPDVLVSRRGGQIIPLLILLAFRRTSTINIAVVLGQRWCPRGRPAGCKSTDGKERQAATTARVQPGSSHERHLGAEAASRAHAC